MVRMFAFCVVMAMAAAVDGIVVESDPYGHSDGTPIAGTVASAPSSVAEAVLDVRASTCYTFDGWTLSSFKPAFMLIVR